MTGKGTSGLDSTSTRHHSVKSCAAGDRIGIVEKSQSDSTKLVGASIRPRGRGIKRASTLKLVSPGVRR